jgi:hypothetical protein
VVLPREVAVPRMALHIGGDAHLDTLTRKS